MADQGNVTEGWAKWQVALAVGAPVALGLAGLWYYNRKQNGSPPPADVEKGKEAVPSSKEAQVEDETPAAKAQAAKGKGNKYFKGGKYDSAISCYTQAIEICPEDMKSELSTYYQNRAAAYEQLKSYKEVISDCTKAIALNNRYVKAMNRRAKACEQTGDLTQCLEDITAVCILEDFRNQGSLMMADRVLKELGRKKAREAYQTRTPVMPSPQFIRTYFSAFSNDPIMAQLESSEKDDGDGSEDSEKEKYRDETPEKEQAAEVPDNAEINVPEKKASPYLQAKEAFKKGEYDQVIPLCSEETNLSNSSFLAEALLLRATFYLLRGEGNKAIEDFDRLLLLENTDKKILCNAYIKRGSLKMQNGEKEEAIKDFSAAAEADSENSDIYHHRGQLNLLIDQVLEAVSDFEKSVKLNPNFAIAHVQKCYTEYRNAFITRSPMQLQSAMKSFEETLAKFPKCAEGYALYGQALCDQQQFERADEYFSTAQELEPDNGNIYVHRGLLRLQWKQNVDESAKLIRKALEIDDKCEFAYETLGTIEVQRGGLDGAITLFNKAISLAKTEVEMAHLFSLLDAAMAQAKVAKNFGIQVPTLGGM